MCFNIPHLLLSSVTLDVCHALIQLFLFAIAIGCGGLTVLYSIILYRYIRGTYSGEGRTSH